MDRRALLVVVAVIGGIAVGTGSFGVVAGTTLAPGDGDQGTFFDSEYRFTSTVWLAAGLALWWSIREPARRAAVTRTVLAVIVVGGLSRVVSVVAVGWPYPVFTAAMVIELVVIPLVLRWHVRAFPSRREPAPLRTR